MIDASMFPLMGYLVDIRHIGVYGSIYAIADTAVCFAYILGPFSSGPLLRLFEFSTYNLKIFEIKSQKFMNFLKYY